MTEISWVWLKPLGTSSACCVTWRMARVAQTPEPMARPRRPDLERPQGRMAWSSW